MNFLEKDLEQIIFETDNHSLMRRGLYIRGIKRRQLRIGNYGVCDLLTFNRIVDHFEKKTFLDISIYELKKQKIGIDSFMQAIRYAKGISSYLNSRDLNNYGLNIILVGSEIENNNIVYLADLLQREDLSSIGINLSIYTYTYTFEGIIFESHFGFELTNEGF